MHFSIGIRFRDVSNSAYCLLMIRDITLCTGETTSRAQFAKCGTSILMADFLQRHTARAGGQSLRMVLPCEEGGEGQIVLWSCLIVAGFNIEECSNIDPKTVLSKNSMCNPPTPPNTRYHFVDKYPKWRYGWCFFLHIVDFGVAGL